MTDPNGLIRPGRPAPGFTLPATPEGRQTDRGNVRHRSSADPNLDAMERLGTDRRVMAG